MTSELSVVRHAQLSVVKGEGREPKRGSQVYLDFHKLFDSFMVNGTTSRIGNWHIFH